MNTLYKFLRTGLKSDSGEHTWKIGKWYKIDGELEICERGFHASKRAIDALGYVAGEIIAVVEVKGKSIIKDDKQCWSEMRVLKAYEWTKEDSVKLAIFSAEQVIGLYGKQYPNDSRPRDAINAAKAYLNNSSKETKGAAKAVAWAAKAAGEAAGAAWAAAWAVKAAWAAGEAARAAWAAKAAKAAWAAAWAVAWAAKAAGEAAGAAWAAARAEESAKMKDRIEVYMVSLLEGKKEL